MDERPVGGGPFANYHRPKSRGRVSLEPAARGVGSATWTLRAQAVRSEPASARGNL